MFVINATDYAPVTPVTPPCDIIPIFIGYKGENHARCLIFDLTDCIEEFGDGGFAISFMRHGDAQPYIVTDTDQLDYTAIWEINATDTAVEGYGMVQLQYIVGETVCKTAMYRTVTFDSNESAGDVPDPYENLLDQIAAYAALAQGSAAAAAQSAANASGEADRIIANTAEVVGDWLGENIGEISGYVIDKSLTVPNAAADAKVTGTWVRGAYITETTSGAIASFPDGADGVPVKDLKVSIVPVQSGTGDPAPDNIRPITGWTQANVNVSNGNLLTGMVSSSGGNVTVTVNNDGSIKLYGTCNSSSTIVLKSGVSLEGGTYALSCKVVGTGGSDNSSRFQVVSTGDSYIAVTWNESDDHVSTATLVTASNYIIRLRVISGTSYDCTLYPMLARGSQVPNKFRPPMIPNVYTIPLNGTVYGGTLDVTTGVLTVTHKKSTISELGFAYSAVNTVRTPQLTDFKIQTDPICSAFKTVAWSVPLADSPDKCIKAGTTSSVQDRLYIKDTQIGSDATTWLSTYGSESVVYELASPQTFALTPTQVTSLLGNNNLWADCGGSDVTYRADPRLYLEKLTNPDSDMIADANIASGSYFMVGNRLYLATSAISLGASIVPGTNCTATDLASALNAINA